MEVVKLMNELKPDRTQIDYQTKDIQQRNMIIFWAITVITILSILPRVNLITSIEVFIQLSILGVLWLLITILYFSKKWIYAIKYIAIIGTSISVTVAIVAEPS